MHFVSAWSQGRTAIVSVRFSLRGSIVAPFVGHVEHAFNSASSLSGRAPLAMDGCRAPVARTRALARPIQAALCPSRP